MVTEIKYLNTNDLIKAAAKKLSLRIKATGSEDQHVVKLAAIVS